MPFIEIAAPEGRAAGGGCLPGGVPGGPGFGCPRVSSLSPGRKDSR
jgi:hypothetical protein